MPANSQRLRTRTAQACPEPLPRPLFGFFCLMSCLLSSLLFGMVAAGPALAADEGRLALMQGTTEGRIAAGRARMDLRGYRLTFDQTFTTQRTLDFTPTGPAGPAGSVWIAHTPTATDWVRFLDSREPYRPFQLTPEGLVIRAQRDRDGTPAGGLLSSMDGRGRGFAQRFGYFEMKARLPMGPGTWPAFWLLSASSITDRSAAVAEIDVVEQYGAAPTALHMTKHRWMKDAKYGKGAVATACGMQTSMHTYGVDVQEDFITYYFDRIQVAQQINDIDEAKTPLYVLVNLAVGGGDETNAPQLLPSPQDMTVEYVKVWQGRGGSSPANEIPVRSFPPGEEILRTGAAVSVSKVELTFDGAGSLVLVDRATGQSLWSNQVRCTGDCSVRFQHDGNIVQYQASQPVWASNTTAPSMRGALLYLSSRPPHLLLADRSCPDSRIVWSALDVPGDPSRGARK